MARINRKMLRDFLQRRKSNVYGLLVITALAAVITLVGALIGFKRTHILVFVTIALIVLCVVQAILHRRSFRTLHAFRGRRKKNKNTQEQPD